MATVEQPYPSILLIIAALGIAVYGWTRWRFRHIRATAGTGALLLWCGSFWMLTNALEMASADLSAAVFWNRMQYIGVTPVPTLWLYMALQFTGRAHVMTRLRLLLLGIIPAVCLSMALTNDFHRLFIASAEIQVSRSFANVTVRPGPCLIILYVQGYLQIVLGTYLLTERLLRTRGFRWQGTVVLLGVALSVTANILDWSELNPIPYIKLTPMALGVSILLFVVTLNRARRADIVPTARGTVIETMQDAVLVLDVENRVIDMNPAAERIIGRRFAAILGMTIDEAWPAASYHIETLSAKYGDGSELRLGEGDLQRVFDVRRSELRDWRGQPLSRIIVFRDITKRVCAEEHLRESLAEKETLLKEVHHRVKNNMQIIASLLNLQAATIDDPLMRAQFEDSQSRIRSMALVHERLYRSQDLASIDLREYLHDLSDYLIQGYRAQGRSINVVVEVEDIQLDIDTAIPCGLIVNELVSNALKHAFPDGAAGTIRIEARRDPEGPYCLIVRDDGIGMPPHFDPAQSKTLGMQLVASLAQQLRGEVAVSVAKGTTVAVTFSPASSPSPVPGAN